MWGFAKGGRWWCGYGGGAVYAVFDGFGRVVWGMLILDGGGMGPVNLATGSEW